MEVKQKVLCFHGFGTNSEMLSYQLRQFKKEFKDIDFITLNGPIPLNRNVIMDESIAKMLENQNIYSWLNFMQFKNNDIDSIFSPALEEVVKILKEQGPFFGVMGFSQGSAIAVRLASKIAAGEIDLGYDLKCFIFVSAQANHIPETKQFLCRIPSLHLIGFNDFVVDRSMGLVVQFLNPYVIYHNQGHKVPTLTYEQVKDLKRFFENPLQDCQIVIIYIFNEDQYLVYHIKNNQCKKKKILCLHGNGANKEFHSYQLRQFEKEFQDLEFITLDGPISIKRNVHVSQVVIPQNFAKMIENKPLFTWGNFLKLNNSNIDAVFQESLDYVIRILREQGPFYGVLGFSQGSAVAARLATLLQNKEVDLGYEFNYFIFSSGSMMNLPNGRLIFCKIPSIHFIGINDFLYDRSLGLSTQFLNPLVILHDQGHKVPFLSRQQIQLLKQFFNKEKKDWQQQIFVPKL
ncbi:unnamed protein product [Paramecium pentaurelia]|uniref:Serine hydrolase domain-containing protein n=1 Tax=Paramecium pentaurelia TaxID=43138 RepID=A0A8S1RVJ9_9CILI|nr:unnamed protein product [Paramecium pentaurelia]